jgi:hypothetical protein
VQAAAELNLGLPQLPDNLFRAVALRGHPASFPHARHPTAQAGSVSGRQVSTALPDTRSVSRWLLVVAVGLGITWACEQGRAPIKVEPRIQETLDLRAGFAKRTGLASDRPPQRYLWIDAFAVCHSLGLADATGDDRYEHLAEVRQGRSDRCS